MKLQEYKQNKMRDSEFAKAYEEVQPEMNIIRAIIDARIAKNMTQKDLSNKTDFIPTKIKRDKDMQYITVFL